jgi:hypothetical protein
VLKLDRQTILDAVHQLPPDEQVEIAREILRTAPRREPPAAPNPHQGTAASLRGIAKTPEPLNDSRLMSETLMERYGDGRESK